jgi:methionine-rich copper-binding protein CopC
MRNLRKLSAVVIAIALVLTSMTAAFAASGSDFEFEAQATVLKDLGIWQGNTDGDLMLGEQLTRAQGAVLVLKTVLGKTEADMEAADVDVLSTFDDAAEVPSWAEGWVALAVKEGVVKGGNNKLAADAPLKGKDLASMFMNALGFADENDYATSVELLAAKSAGDILADIAADITDEDLTRDAATAVVFDTLTAKAKDATKTVIDVLVGTNADLKAVAVKAGLIVAPTELTVESITASNLREVVVKFNKEVEKTSAESLSNYISDTSKLEKAALQADGKTVKLFIKAGTANQTTFDFAIKNVKDTAGVALAATYTKSLYVFDAEVPNALSYKFTGPQNIEVTFSEPINGTTSAISILVDNGIYGANATVKADDEYVVDVELGAPLTEGNHTVVVKGAKDFVGYTALDKTFEVNYVKDTTVPTVSVEATQTDVTFTFNKPVKGLSIGAIYHTYSSYKPFELVDASGNAVAEDKYYDKVKAKFVVAGDDTKKLPLPAGSNTKVVLIANPHDDVIVQDRYGNTIATDQIFNVTVTADTTAPTISAVTVKSEKKVVLSYSEEVTGRDETTNFVVKKADGTVVANSEYSVSPLTEDDTYKTEIAFNNNLAGGAYSVEVSNLKDTSLNTNAMGTKTVTFNVTDLTGVSTASFIPSDDGKTLYVTFPETMSVSGANSILNQSNYLYGADAEHAKALTDAAITVFGTADKAKIVLPWDFDTNNLYIKTVADAAGNIMTAMFIPATSQPNDAPEVTKVKTIALNKLEITVDKHLSSLSAANILVNDTVVAQASFVNTTDDGDPIAVITVTLRANTTSKTDNTLANGSDFPTKIEIKSTTVGSETSTFIKSITGKAMVASATIVGDLAAADKVDGVAPVVKDVKIVSATQISVIFDEAIAAGSFTTIGKNGFSVVGGTLDSVALSGTTVTLTGKDFNKYTDVVYTAGNLCDDAENSVASFSYTKTLSNP